jgi:hypothetical protein
MIQIALPPDTEEVLRKKANASGEDVSLYASRLLQVALSTPSVDELLAPFRKQIEESGITDEQLGSLGEELLDDARQEQQARKLKTG